MSDPDSDFFSDDEWEEVSKVEEEDADPPIDTQVRDLLQALWGREATGVGDRALVPCTQSMRRYFRRTVKK